MTATVLPFPARLVPSAANVLRMAEEVQRAYGTGAPVEDLIGASEALSSAVISALRVENPQGV